MTERNENAIREVVVKKASSRQKYRSFEKVP
jgi:hypothetical protein